MAIQLKGELPQVNWKILRWPAKTSEVKTLKGVGRNAPKLKLGDPRGVVRQSLRDGKLKNTPLKQCRDPEWQNFVKEMTANP